MPLLTLDSRARDDYDTTTSKDVRIEIENSISFRKISLIFMDLPVDDSVNESIYYIRFREFPKNIKSASFQDYGAFCVVKQAGNGFRSISFENETFAQTIDLGEVKTFSEFNISLHYRNGASAPLTLTSDWSIICRIE